MSLRKLKHVIKYCDYIKDFSKFKKLKSKSQNTTKMSWKNRLPCLNEKTTETYFDRHYIYHTGWAARSLNKIKPTKHIDISSSLYFASIASAFVPMTFYDYRPAKIELPNLSYASADLLNLQFESNSIKSLSCMHVVEHIGLGRYGDPIDKVTRKQ